MSNINWDQIPVILNVKQLARVMNLGTNSTYELVHSKGFPSIRIGRQLKIPRDQFRKWLDDQVAK